MPLSFAWAAPFSPYIFGIDGPVISASRIPTLQPFFAIWFAREAVTKDLPTPPLPLTMPITCLTLEDAFIAACMLCGFFLLLQPSQLVLSQVLLSHSFAISISPFPYISESICNCSVSSQLYYFINLSIARSSSLSASLSPCSTASTIQCSI